MSAKKRTSLSDVFGHLQPAEHEPVRLPAEPVRIPPPKEVQVQTKRPGIKQQTAYLPEPIYEQLRKLGFEEKRKLHSYIMEGLDRVFAERGLPSIKELIP